MIFFLQAHYESVLRGADAIESCLHLCLKEHLNAEVTLGTINDVSMAVAWLRTTFLYVRAQKNPEKYGIVIANKLNPQLRRSKIEQHLFGMCLTSFFQVLQLTANKHALNADLCVRELNALNQLGLIEMQDMQVIPTSTGKLMARHYIAYDTMALFSKVQFHALPQSR